MNTELTKRVDPILAALEGMIIDSDVSAMEAAKFLKKIKDTKAIIELHYKSDIEAAYRAHKALTDERKYYLDQLKTAEKSTKGKIGTYRIEQERLQAEETRRLTEDARKKTEDMMLEKALQTGDESILERSVAEVKIEAPAPVKLDGISYATNWSFEITDPAKVPMEFLMPDEKKIGAYIRMHEGKYEILGVKIIKSKQVRVN